MHHTNLCWLKNRHNPSSKIAFQAAAQMLCAGYSVPTALHIHKLCMFYVTVIETNKHTRTEIVIQAGCIAAGVGKAFSRVCLFVIQFP